MILVGNGYESFVIKDESVTISSHPGATFSVFALGGEARGVTILGGKYDANEVTLQPEFPLGVSNSFGERDVTVSVRSGAVLIMRQI